MTQQILLQLLAKGKSMNVSEASSSFALLPPIPYPIIHSVTLSFLPHNLHSNRITMIIHAYNTLAEVTNLTLPTVPYPLEVVHVGGLYWSAYECQVVDFCRLLISLVGLNKQLVKQQRERQ